MLTLMTSFSWTEVELAVMWSMEPLNRTATALPMKVRMRRSGGMPAEKMGVNP